ncbi:armadillo repeat-containing protein 1-like isoform X2 [Pelobates fuscus]|uniref:armadillo repeat-containing protein 1-like isoform X2 n=1 Tax=Pelobates fuscus TaxID=191477 RepID=UPI002FE44123
MEAMSVVNHLRNLASDPQNRASIMRDKSCLAGLILFLDHREACVVESALKTISYLSEDPTHCEIMRNELGMMVSLESIKNRCDINDDLKQLAQSIYASFTFPSQKYTPEKTKPQFFISSCNKRVKTVTLHIHGLDDMEKKNICEEALLKVRGVISFTFQLAVRRCTIRVKSDLATEVYVPLPKIDLPVEKNSCLPDYLPEEESPQKDLERAITCPGLKVNCRGSWINTAANFLTKTFYW